MIAWPLLLCISAQPHLTREPVLLEQVPPIYPLAAKLARREGAVGLRLTLGADGSVERVEVVASGGHDFDWAALGALTQFRFSPAEVDGKPAAIQLDYTLTFALPRETTPPLVSQPPPAVLVAASVALELRVRESGTVRPVSFAEVTLAPMPPGSAPPLVHYADSDGRLTLRVPAGPYEIGVGAQGFDPFVQSQYFEHGSLHQLDVALTPEAANRFETIVQARRGEPPVSRVSLSRAEVTGIPGTYGDALRVIESLPGVARAPLLGGALMVRGGYPADTQVHFEGVPIPVLYHFGGFTSVINGAFVEEIQFMAGGFPARYGNATAGIVDVRAHALNSDTPQAHFDVDDFDVGAFFGGSVQPVQALPRLRFGMAARRSHAEIPSSLALEVANTLNANIPFLPVPVYYDYQLKLQADLNASTRVSFFLFGAEDNWAVLGDQPILGTDAGGAELSLDQLLNTFLSNRWHRALLAWELKLAPGVTSAFKPWVGVTRRGLLSEGVAVPLLSGNSLDAPVEETNFGLRQELTFVPSAWWRTLVGVEAIGALADRQLLPGDEVFEGDDSELPIITVEQQQLAVALYADTTVQLTERLSVTPGARLEVSAMRFDTGGRRLYDGEQLSVVSAVTLDPRVQVRFVQSDLLTWKAAFGTFHQRPRAQSAAYDTDGTTLDPPGSAQVIGGFEAKLWGPLTFDAQIYGTRRTGLVRERARFYNPQAPPFAPVSTTGSFDSFGGGDTGGVEMMLRHQPNAWFFGWVSYTFSRTVVSLGDKREAEVPFPFDQTHNLVTVARVNLPWQLTLGGRFAFVTGNPGPVSDAVAVRHTLNDNVYSPVSSSLRPSRLPPFHRLDLRVDRRFIFSWATVVPFLEVINVYNYPNPEVVFPAGDYRFRELRILLPSPPVLPLIGVELTL